MMHDAPNQTRLFAKIIRDLLSSETFDSLSDLTAAVKDRCAKLRIPYQDGAVNGAMTLIASNTQLTLPPPQLQRVSKHPTEAVSEAPVITQAQAAAILQRLGVRVSGSRVARQTDDEDGLVEV